MNPDQIQRRRAQPAHHKTERKRYVLIKEQKWPCKNQNGPQKKHDAEISNTSKPYNQNNNEKLDRELAGVREISEIAEPVQEDCEEQYRQTEPAPFSRDLCEIFAFQ